MSVATIVFLVVGWWCRGTFAREKTRMEGYGKSYRSDPKTMNYGLRYSPRWVRIWDCHTSNNVFRDIYIGVPNFSHRCRVVWCLFDEQSTIGKLILHNLEVEINDFTFGKGLPLHDHMLVGDHIVDTTEL